MGILNEWDRRAAPPSKYSEVQYGKVAAIPGGTHIKIRYGSISVYVAYDPSAFPNLSVGDHVAFVRVRGTPSKAFLLQRVANRYTEYGTNLIID